jgi:NADP-reducing hydrogenase subunit HndA
VKRRDMKQDVDKEFLEYFEQIRNIINENREKTGALIRILEQTQALISYLPPQVLEVISKDLKIPLSEVYGVVSFYNFFTMVPKGKYTIEVCMGTACHVRGNPRNLDALRKEFGIEIGETTENGKYSLDIIRCFGCCGLSPIVRVGGDLYRRVNPTKLKKILTQYE